MPTTTRTSKTPTTQTAQQRMQSNTCSFRTSPVVDPCRADKAPPFATMEDVAEEAPEENTENLAADPEAGHATMLSTALTRNPESSSPKVCQDPGEPNDSN